MNEALQALRRFAAPAASPRCELCSARIDDVHEHLLEVEAQSLACCCTACACLFDTATGGRLRVRPTTRVVAAEAIDVEVFATPIRVAWAAVVRDEPRLAYPGPAGIVTHPLDAGTWTRMAEGMPVLASLAPDVEALLVDLRERPRAFVVSIDRCFELAGIVRRHFSGLSGGTIVHREIEAFLRRLEAAA